MRRFFALPVLMLAAPALAESRKAGWHLVPGSFEPGQGPDGNSVFLEAPEGLILVDTGRHPRHQEKLLAYARSRGKPIAAIVNTHWHLDHSGGNAEIRAAYPKAAVHGGTALEGALTGFFPQSRKSAEEFLASGQASANLLDCAGSRQAREACVAGWKRDAAAFIPADDRRVDAMVVGHYLDTRLRAAPEQRDRFCRPLR